MPKGITPAKSTKTNDTYGLGSSIRAVKGAYESAVSDFKQAGQAISTTFKPPAPIPQYNNQFVPPQNIPAYHQVKDGESMADVSNQYGVPLKDLTEINQAKTLPPKGSYIQLTAEQKGLMNQFGVPPSVAAQIKGATGAYPGEGRGDPAAQALRNQANVIMKQLASGQDPNQIPVNLLGFIKDPNGQTLTLQMALQAGYVMNAQGVLVKSGAPSPEFAATAGYQANMNKDFLQQTTYIGNKRMTVGEAIRKGLLDIKTGRRFNSPMKRNKKGKLVPANRGGGGTVAPAPVTNIPMAQSSETPQTVLDIHLGSG